MTGATWRSIGYAIAAAGFLVPALAFALWPGPAALTDRLALSLLFGLPAVINGYRAAADLERDVENTAPQSLSSIIS